MKFLEKFHQTVGFTRTERRVILFLVAALIAGAGIKLYKYAFVPVQQFDYSSVDSEFTVRSGTILPEDSLTGNRTDSPAATDSAKQHAGGKSVNLPPRSVDINSATKQELTRLPGIGEEIAERIIIYRDENGKFETLDELTGVKGIGKKKLDRIRPYCRIGK